VANLVLNRHVAKTNEEICKGNVCANYIIDWVIMASAYRINVESLNAITITENAFCVNKMNLVLVISAMSKVQYSIKKVR
jgi:hypothetical protein